MSIRVVMAGDHAMVREALTRYLATTPDIRVVAGVAGAGDVTEAVLRCKPDVLLLDIDLAGMAVLDAARRVRALCPLTRLVILSGFIQDWYVERALEVGASGYLTKAEPVGHIVKAIRDVAAGKVHFSPKVRARLAMHSARVRTGTQPRTYVASLTARQLEVLRHVARGLRNKEIAASMRVAVRTVDHHVARIMGKLGLHGRVTLARFAIREGLAEP